MIHMHDAPPSAGLLAERRTTRSQDMLAEGDAEIVFHPDGVANRVMRARHNQELGRRTVIEIALAIIRQNSVASIKVSARGKDDHLRIKAFSKRSLVRPVESRAAEAHLLFYLGYAGVKIPGLHQQPRRRPLEI